MKKTRVTTGRRQWTADEHADLWRLTCEGVQLSEIARRLGRDLSSCFGRLKKTDDSGQYMSTHRPGAMRWTPGMDARVLELREAGMTNNQVGEMIGLRGTQVASRVRELRALSAASSTGNLESRSASDIARGPAVRRCLMCGHEFGSSSANNRRCVPCNRRAESFDSPFNPGIVGVI